MPSIGVKLYSVFFKLMLKHRLQSRLQTPENDASGGSFGVTSRPDEETAAAANPSFTDGVATKDIHIDPITSLSVRVFLPDTCLQFPETRGRCRTEPSNPRSDLNQALSRRYSHGSSDSMTVSGSNGISVRRPQNADGSRRNSYGCSIDDSVVSDKGIYRGYNPVGHNHRRLPVMLQFHGGGFVSGSNDSAANDFFCRRIARLCDVIVVAVGYRLAPEDKYPAAFDDGFKVVNWLAKQANLAECSKTLVSSRGGGGVDLRRSEGSWQVSDAFGSSMVEPWLAAHGDPSRCVLLGVSCGANIANHMARKVVEAGRLVDPVKVVAQVLMYPFFMGSIPTRSEIKLANSYFYDKPMCVLAWKLFLPPTEFSLDHPAANPLAPGRAGPPLKRMPPTLTVVAEHDWMRDRAIAYSEELRKVNVDAPVLDYKDAVHEFATLDILLKTPQAQACAEDVAIWVKKYISLRGHEFSY